jgi:tRNA A-37 threonylcarbamoyl transferase component Bud32
VLGERIKDKDCKTDVFKFSSTSHTVCRYRFRGEHYSVIAKFFAEPSSELKDYDAHKAMMNEYRNLAKAGQFINVSRPIAIHSDFNCVLVTEYIKGKNILWYLDHREHLYDILKSIALMLRRLHDNTHTYYNKEKEFANYHHLLDQLGLDPKTREQFNELLGKWWYSPLIDRDYGCMVHRDVSPLNYIIRQGTPFAIDMESCWHHANSIRDVGTLCAEMKNYFQLNCESGNKAEPYIGHFLWHYSRSEKEFRQISRTLPFFMSIGLLRPARLYRHSAYYNDLLKEALKCLKAIE